MIELPLNDPKQWPVRMTRAECAHVNRWSERTLRKRIAERRFPPPDDGHTWAREDVVRYVEGGIQNFEDDFEKRQQAEKRRRSMRVVGASG